MADGVTFKITDAKELNAVLKELGAQVAGKIGDQAVRAGAMSAYSMISSALPPKADISDRLSNVR